MWESEYYRGQVAERLNCIPVVTYNAYKCLWTWGWEGHHPTDGRACPPLPPHPTTPRVGLSAAGHTRRATAVRGDWRGPSSPCLLPRAFRALWLFRGNRGKRWEEGRGADARESETVRPKVKLTGRQQSAAEWRFRWTDAYLPLLFLLLASQRSTLWWNRWLSYFQNSHTDWLHRKKPRHRPEYCSLGRPVGKETEVGVILSRPEAWQQAGPGTGKLGDLWPLGLSGGRCGSRRRGGDAHPETSSMARWVTSWRAC